MCSPFRPQIALGIMATMTLRKWRHTSLGWPKNKLETHDWRSFLGVVSVKYIIVKK